MKRMTYGEAMWQIIEARSDFDSMLECVSRLWFDDTMDGEPWEVESMERIEIKNRWGLAGKRWWWTLNDTTNGQILATSQVYSRRIDCVDIAVRIARRLGCAVEYK